MTEEPRLDGVRVEDVEEVALTELYPLVFEERLSSLGEARDLARGTMPILVSWALVLEIESIELRHCVSIDSL